MLNKLKKDIDRALKAFPERIKADYELHLTSRLLFDGLKDFLGRGGKRIRPLLFLISYQGYTKRRKISYEKLLRCSLSLELLHDFLLVHDDVIDKSDLRRGKPTLHRVFNKKLGLPAKDGLGSDLSIVAGDIIFALAIDAFLSIEEEPSRKERALKIFTGTAVLTGAGEFMDVVNNTRKIEKVTRKDVFLTYALKTAKYTFESPLVIGATLGGAGKEEIENLSALGMALGQAFQIQDDLLDLFSTSKKIGKPVLSDLSESKKTLLVWTAYKKLDKKGKKTLKRLLEKPDKTYRDLLGFRKLIKQSGAHKHCFDRIRTLRRQSNELLSGLRIKTKYKVALEQLISELFSKTEELEDSL